MSEDPSTAWITEYCLRPYHPRILCGAPNPDFCKAADGRLLDFKEGKQEAVEAETGEFKKALIALQLPRSTILVVVPGHEERNSNEDRPLARVVRALSKCDDRYVPMVDALIRTRTILRRSTSGDRSFVATVRSMRVTDAASLKRAVVVVLDDTVTTGKSVAAARWLLLEAGATRVAAVALARTVKYF